ncbi:phosphoribosylglycinamide formyltransferase [Parasediminibacterium paludis]|uniref:Phosphoribosylglycinamide formyltransferase n=1 Tax=Parasediminibacterium paludis TaxID=908966 RepID=A0ABV8PUV5_9BACT
MVKKWKEKWKVSWLQFTLIICTFAFGGSLCGITGRKLLSYISIEKGFIYLIIYIITISILWPFCVLFVSIPLGQFTFFRNYLHRMSKRMTGKVTSTKQIAIFASGAGSNAAKIIEHLQHNQYIKVKLVVCNKPEAGVLAIAELNNIETLLIEKEPFFRGDAYVNILKAKQIDFIVLAGFLWKVPAALIKAYPDKIINIHPALLPKYGGKGMYGHFVHEAVVANGETESGITIHYVNENFDEGKHIFQASCAVTKADTPDTVAAKIHQLEHLHFPRIVEEVVLSANK